MKFRDGPVAITALIVFAVWLFIGLPIYYGPNQGGNGATDQCASEEYKNHGFWEKTRCDPVAYFTLWLVSFTGVLAGVSIFQGVILIRSDKSTRIAAEAAKINAEAAKKSAELAERSFFHSRSPAFAFQRTMFKNIGIGKIPSLEVTFKNIGRGDAYGWNMESNCEVVPIERLNETFKMPGQESSTVYVASGSDQMRTISAKVPLTADDIEKIRQEKAALCVWGQVVFEDVERSKMCDVFSYAAIGKDFDTTRPEFGKCKVEIEWPHTEGNDKDDQKATDH